MIKLLIVSFVFIASFVSYTNGQISNALGCPPITLKNDFEVNRFTGKWYQFERIKSNEEANQKCTRNEYTLNGNKLTIVLKSIDTTNGQVRNVNSTGDIDPTSKVGKWFMWWNANYPQTHYVLDTDYKDYAVIYSCVDYWVVHYEFVWILRRKKKWNFIPPIKAYANLLLRAYISNDKLTATDRNDCPWKM